MTTKEFIIGVIVTALIYGFVTLRKEEPNYAAYSDPQIQVIPYTTTKQIPWPEGEYTISE